MRRYYILLLLALCSCVKDKKDSTIPLLDVSNKSASGIRLFNFYGATLDISINNIPLTAFTLNGNSSVPVTGQQATQIGLSLFPSGGWSDVNYNGAPFQVPNSLLDKNNRIHVIIQARSAGVGQSTVAALDTIIENDVVHPKDYYLLYSGHMQVLERDNVPPANAQNFKLRVINLQGPDDMLGMNGPVTLTYADGSIVSELLSNVAPGTASPYIELPFATYQFKPFISMGGSVDWTKQFADLPNYPKLNPCMVMPLQEAIPTQLRTYKPGGVYSIVITANGIGHFACDKFSQGTDVYNSYRVLTETDPGVNYNFARLSAVNALPGKQVTVKIDGQPLGGQLDFVGNTPQDIAYRPVYSAFVQGPHTVELIDADGTELAKNSINLYPFDNYTIWAFEKTDGKPDLLFEANDMTGTLYTNFTSSNQYDDGTNGAINRVTITDAVETRFLNLSPDVPYATFYNDQQPIGPIFGNRGDSLRAPGAFTSLVPGTQPLHNPAIIYSMGPYDPWGNRNALFTDNDFLPSLIRVYQSRPDAMQPEVPGQLLADVVPLNARKAYIANPAMYTMPGLAPNAENGTYTIALVGHEKTGNAKIILIKHNN